MIARRRFLALAGATAAATPLTARAGQGVDAYGRVAAKLRAPLPETPGFTSLVRFATLAPNGHNTQPWTFADHGAGVTIEPDLTRRTPAVDPDDHHLFVSLGCAAENLLIAAGARGRPGAVAFDPVGEGRIAIHLGQAPPRADILFRAIPARQSTRSIYDGQPVSPGDLRSLARAASVDGVSVRFLTEPGHRDAVMDLVILGNSLQMDDPAFVKELKSWIRFNPDQAVKTADGLYSGCTGNPALPTWLGEGASSLVLTKDGENAKYRSQIRSSAGIAIFVGDKEDKDHWVRVGRSFQRFGLMATALGIRHAPINQPVESPIVRVELAGLLGAPTVRPDLCVRFGHAPAMPMSLRRPVDQVTKIV